MQSKVQKAGVKVIGFDINEQRINELAAGIDGNNEIAQFDANNLVFTYEPSRLEEANTYLISVPTPLNTHQIPDLKSLKAAAKLIAKFLKKGDIVVLESTVYPGATRELIMSTLEQRSELISGQDYFVGYSSERIVPGDKQLTLLTTATKVISGQNADALNKIKELYQPE